MKKGKRLTSRPRICWGRQRFLLEAAEGVRHDTPRCCGADLLFL